MKLAEIEKEVMKLSEEDRADLATMIWESLDGADPNDSDEDSLTEAKRRSEELWSGAVKGIPEEEFMAEFRAMRAR
jgi:putative addiction module component (TIGR02574 family)